MIGYLRGCRFQRYSSESPTEISGGVNDRIVERFIDSAFGRIECLPQRVPKASRTRDESLSYVSRRSPLSSA